MVTGQQNLSAKLTADTSGFNSAMGGALSTLSRFKGTLIAVGGIVASGKFLASAITEASEFQSELATLRSEADLTAGEVKGIGDQAQRLAQNTGEATSKIVEGFKFARSAGISLAESQRLVETATKASAAGFGEQRDLVRTATTAMNAWSDEIESGTDFLDTLTATAQNTDIEVSGLASAFRRNINMASSLGLTLKETTSALGAISGAVGSASRGGRLLQQVMAGLQNPTKRVREQLNELFGSTERFQTMLAEDGLVATMTELQDRLQANGKSMADFFKSTRRSEGALALVADEGKRTKEIMSSLEDTTGNVEEAFDDSATAGRNWKKTQAQLRNIMIDLGETVLPLVNDGLSEFQKVVANLRGEDAPVQVDKFENLNSTLDESNKQLQRLDNTFSGMETSAQSVSNLFLQDLNMEDRRVAISSFQKLINERLTALDDKLSPEVFEKLTGALDKALQNALDNQLADPATLQKRINAILNAYKNMDKVDTADKVSDEEDEKEAKDKGKDVLNAWFDGAFEVVQRQGDTLSEQLNRAMGLSNFNIDQKGIMESLRADMSNIEFERKRNNQPVPSGTRFFSGDLANEVLGENDEQSVELKPPAESDILPGGKKPGEVTTRKEQMDKILGIQPDPFGESKIDDGKAFEAMDEVFETDDGVEETKNRLEKINDEMSSIKVSARDLQTLDLVGGSKSAEQAADKIKDVRRTIEAPIEQTIFRQMQKDVFDLEDAALSMAKNVGRALQRNIADRLSKSLVNAIPGMGSKETEQGLIGTVLGEVGGAIKTHIPFFNDTPGVMQMESSGLVGMAEGDKFAASQTESGLKGQVEPKVGGSDSERIEQHNHFEFATEETVRAEIKNALPLIKKETKNAMASDIKKGGDLARAVRNA